MRATYTEVTNPKFKNPEQSQIDLWVKFDHLMDEYPEGVPFCADPTDCMAHGRELYQRALAGDFGPVAAYTPPPPLPLEEQEIVVRQQRDTLLTQSDWTQLPDVPEETKAKWAPYRQQLRDVTLQKGFPYNVIWPTEPI